MELKGIELKNGEKIRLNKFTLLVGPNNVGKSQTLKDIHNRLTKGAAAETTLVSSITLDRPSSYEELIKDLVVRPDPINVGHECFDGITSDFNPNSMLRMQTGSLEKVFTSQPEAGYTLYNLSKFRVFYMDSESRLSIASSCKSYIPDESTPTSLVQALYGKFGKLDDKLEDAFETTFKKKIRLDYSAGPRLRFAVGDSFENIPQDSREAYPIMKEYASLEEQGDGFRSFVAVILCLLLSKGKVLLLDEPEAFLHPEQARRLGKWIADHIETFPCQVIVATHNANFLSGVLAGRQPAEIFRLNRKNDITDYCPITADATRALATSPILSSQRVLEGIFARGVVVCEADSDRVIYNSVAIHNHNEQELLFLHAHNKQTVKDVVSLLKAASIPVAAVVDIDIFNSNDELDNLLSAFDPNADHSKALALREKLGAHVDKFAEDEVLDKIKKDLMDFLDQLENKEHTLEGARAALKRIRGEGSKWSKVKSKGLSVFEKDIRTEAMQLVDECKNQGLFVVPVGELEGWMDLGVRKNRWVLLALERISDGNASNELIGFVGKIISWVYGNAND